MDSDELEPATISGILKTILLFLEGQNFIKTCETFLLETSQLGYPTIRSAIAQVLILKPVITEIVKITRPEPDADIRCTYPTDSNRPDNIDNAPRQGQKDAEDTPFACFLEDTQDNKSEFKAPIRSSIQNSTETNEFNTSGYSAQTYYFQSGTLPFDTTELRRTEDVASTISSSTCVSTVEENLPECPCLPCEVCNALTPISSRSLPLTRNTRQMEKKTSSLRSKSQSSFVRDNEAVVSQQGLTILSKPSGSLNKRDSKTAKIEGKCKCEVELPICGSLQTLNKQRSASLGTNTSVTSSRRVNTTRSDKSILSARSSSSSQRMKYRKQSTSVEDAVITEQKAQTSRSDIVKQDQKPAVSCAKIVPTNSPVNFGSPARVSSSSRRIRIIDSSKVQETATIGSSSIEEKLVSELNYHSLEEKTNTTSRDTNFNDQKRNACCGCLSNDPIQSSRVKTSTSSRLDGREATKEQESYVDKIIIAEQSDRPCSSGEEELQPELDYNKLKQDFITATTADKMLLLQALRWRITKSSSDARSKVMVDIATYDLLGFHGKTCGQECSLLLSCLLTEEHPSQLQEGMARLLNAVASCTIGRDYLCQDDRILRFTIIPLVSGKHTVTISDATREHLLATLQKLSLRSKMRVVMIESGLPEYLVEFISNKHNKVSDYCLEYTSALFMNLCLHKETRLSMQNISNYLLSMLTNIIMSCHLHCFPYINGAMYSLFSNPGIREQARNSCLYNILLRRVKQFDGDIKQQFELIIKVLAEGKLLPPCVDCKSVNEDVEVDHIEHEIDIADTVTGSPNGEQLLKNYRYETSRKETFNNSLLCLCIPVSPHKKITVKSFCSGGHPESDELPSLGAVLSTVAEIDKEIQRSQGREVHVQEKQQQSFTKDKTITAKVSQRNKCTPKKVTVSKDRFYPTSPIIYEPKDENPYIAQDRRNRCQRTKYSCECYSQMQKFVQNNCGHCRCQPCGRNVGVRVLYDSPKGLSRRNVDDDLFQSAIELIALNCYKSNVTLPTHIDCECYTTIFRSRPRIHRTP